MGSLLLKFLVGAAAGLAAWAVMEPFHPAPLDPRWAGWESTFMLVLGALVGLCVGGLDGWSRGGKLHLIRGSGLGLFLGGIGATLGRNIGGAASSNFFGTALETGSLPEQILARTTLFIPIGLCLGVAIGASSLTSRRALQGAIGGAIGAAIGGLTFDIVATVTKPMQLGAMGVSQGEVGGPSRAITFTVMGAAIALFIGLVERFSRSAWLRLNLGRNEGREWSIDSAQTFIGRSEGAQVPLFGDPNIAAVHAQIQKQGRQYVIVDGGSPVGTLVNGQFVQSAILNPGDAIQIGGFVLQFLVKGIPAPARPVDGMVRPMQAMPVAQMPAPTQAMPGSMSGSILGGQTQGIGAQTQAYPSAPMAGNQTVAYGGAPAGRSLLAIDGPLTGQRFPVSGLLEIGREASGIRLIGDANASRRHASVAPGGAGVQVMDLGSTNGTLVNGHPVSTANAMPGDMIKIGGTTFRVE